MMRLDNFDVVALAEGFCRSFQQFERDVDTHAEVGRDHYRDAFGGIGQRLFESLQAFDYREVSTIAIIIIVAVTLIDMLSQAMRKRLL